LPGYAVVGNFEALNRFMRVARMTFAVALLLIGTSAYAGTRLDFWHSYVHAGDHQMHYSFHLTQYKRGLFWGSCGPSTKSLQWSFTFDLAGDGPVYSSEQITVSDDNGKPARIVSGQVVRDPKRDQASIAIELERAGITNKFIGNGKYRINKAR
jgi:hypothetical protein